MEVSHVPVSRRANARLQQHARLRRTAFRLGFLSPCKIKTEEMHANPYFKIIKKNVIWFIRNLFSPSCRRIFSETTLFFLNNPQGVFALKRPF